MAVEILGPRLDDHGCPGLPQVVVGDVVVAVDDPSATQRIDGSMNPLRVIRA